jgi:hypothetical protein
MNSNLNIDGLLLYYNYQFLLDFSKEQFEITDIRIKFNKFRGASTYRTYSTINSFYEAFREILTDSDYTCYVGMYGIIESCKIKNLSLNFENQYTVKTITSLIQVQKNFKYDSYRRKHNTSEVDSYEKYMYKKFNMYIQDVKTIEAYRNSTYIDPCYIDPDYFDGDKLKLVNIRDIYSR